MSGDRWLAEYNEASAKADEAAGAITEKDRIVRSGGNPSRATSQIRRLLNELSLAVSKLEDGANEAGRKYHITDKELLRRQDLVATLKGRREQLQQQFTRSMSGGDDWGRDALIGSGGSSGRRRYQDDEHTRGLDSHDLLQQQHTIMREQDQGLDLLAQSIARQKQLGIAIGDELDDQNDMLEDLTDAVDNTDRRLKKETRFVVHVSEKAKTRGMLCCIVLLILAIIIVAAAPI